MEWSLQLALKHNQTCNEHWWSDITQKWCSPFWDRTLNLVQIPGRLRSGECRSLHWHLPGPHCPYTYRLSVVAGSKSFVPAAQWEQHSRVSGSGCAMEERWFMWGKSKRFLRAFHLLCGSQVWQRHAGRLFPRQHHASPLSPVSAQVSAQTLGWGLWSPWGRSVLPSASSDKRQ